MPQNSSVRTGGRRRSYSMTNQGHSDQFAQVGNHILKPGVASLWKPGWNNGPTTIRIFPGLNPYRTDQGQPFWDPYRFPMDDQEDPNGFGDFIRCYPAVKNMGDPGVSYIYHDRSDDSAVDPQMTPAWVLRRAIERAKATGQDQPGWSRLLDGGQGRGAQLAKPTDVYVVQGVVCHYNSRTYAPPKGLKPDEQLVVIELGRSAGMALMAELQKEVEGYSGDPGNTVARYVNGDPISLTAGKFVTFYTLAQGDPREANQPQQQKAGWDMSNQSGGGSGGSSNDPKGYGCFMEDTFQGQPASIFSQYEGIIQPKVKPWDELLDFPTIEKQAQLLADKFPPAVIEYAWRDSNPEWIPEEVARKAKGSVQGHVPPTNGQAGDPYGAQPQPQPQANLYGAPAQPAMPPQQQAAAPQSQVPATDDVPFDPIGGVPTPPADAAPAQGAAGWDMNSVTNPGETPAQPEAGLPAGTIPPSTEATPPGPAPAAAAQAPVQQPVAEAPPTAPASATDTPPANFDPMGGLPATAAAAAQQPVEQPAQALTPAQQALARAAAQQKGT